MGCGVHLNKYDIRQRGGGSYKQSLSYAGMNSIIVYVGSELLQSYFPFSWEGQNDSHLNLLAANLVAVSIWLIISYYWYWIGFFVKI